jgi:hypothetical protein
MPVTDHERIIIQVRRIHLAVRATCESVQQRELLRLCTGKPSQHRQAGRNLRNEFHHTLLKQAPETGGNNAIPGAAAITASA